MTFHRNAIRGHLLTVVLLAAAAAASAQSGSAGSLRGTVTDPTGAVIPNATVHLTNQLSGLDRTVTSDGAGQFTIPNVAFNPYRIQVKADGFATLNQNITVNSSVGTTVTLVLQIAGNSQTVTVEAQGDLIEDDPTFHTDVDRDLFNKVPLESQSSTLSSLVTLTTPGVSADSNGLFHGLGDHASNSFSVDVAGRQIHHITRLLEDLFDVSRITRGAIELRKKVVDLSQVVIHAVEDILLVAFVMKDGKLRWIEKAAGVEEIRLDKVAPLLAPVGQIDAGCR